MHDGPLGSGRGVGSRAALSAPKLYGVRTAARTTILRLTLGGRLGESAYSRRCRRTVSPHPELSHETAPSRFALCPHRAADKNRGRGLSADDLFADRTTESLSVGFSVP
ncbi:hypothetical protein HMPREF9440_01509 [Sutterella parvirubra YIT 11816]|uniref:Uncharacterized protein n=1 Tax=Sutterella parvirubra YIT 11816 TaxID=762967 RepID=H3KFJ1_9BURK|nr:hypothetical protein HMPREF9440_01509 [Sutterella parvirubra YIT 11816]